MAPLSASLKVMGAINRFSASVAICAFAVCSIPGIGGGDTSGSAAAPPPAGLTVAAGSPDCRPGIVDPHGAVYTALAALGISMFGEIALGAAQLSAAVDFDDEAAADAAIRTRAKGSLRVRLITLASSMIVVGALATAWLAMFFTIDPRDDMSTCNGDGIAAIFFVAAGCAVMAYVQLFFLIWGGVAFRKAKEAGGKDEEKEAVKKAEDDTTEDLGA